MHFKEPDCKRFVKGVIYARVKRVMQTKEIVAQPEFQEVKWV